MIQSSNYVENSLIIYTISMLIQSKFKFYLNIWLFATIDRLSRLYDVYYHKCEHRAGTCALLNRCRQWWYNIRRIASDVQSGVLVLMSERRHRTPRRRLSSRSNYSFSFGRTCSRARKVFRYERAAGEKSWQAEADVMFVRKVVSS